MPKHFIPKPVASGQRSALSLAHVASEVTAGTQPAAYPGITTNSVSFHLYSELLRPRVTTTCSGDTRTCSWGFLKITSICENWAFSTLYSPVTSRPERAESKGQRHGPAGYWPAQEVLSDYVPQYCPSPAPSSLPCAQHSLTLESGFHNLFSHPLVAFDFGRATNPQ